MLLQLLMSLAQKHMSREADFGCQQALPLVLLLLLLAAGHAKHVLQERGTLAIQTSMLCLMWASVLLACVLSQGLTD